MDRLREGELLFKQESYSIMGACFEVYKEKGCGFLEPVYQECLQIEFGLQAIPVTPQSPLKLSYKGRPLLQKYVPDFICYGAIVLEIKAVEMLVDAHRAQVLNYLSAAGFQLGLLVNFGHYPRLESERLANTRRTQQPDFRARTCAREIRETPLNGTRDVYSWRIWRVWRA